MKNKIFKFMAAVTAAIICLCSINVFAIPSTVYANKDYRNIDVINKQGVKVNKPTAQFAANRIAGGEVADVAISYDDYDLNEEYPTLICYVGDTLTFTDMSRDNNGGELTEWDWQYEGQLGTLHNVYKRNVVNETSFNLTEPGETFFYLCVRNDADVKNGCCDPWSENGNHQTVGKNRWFPKGAYWYFTAVRVVVKPKREAKVNVRYWDAPNNRIFHEECINIGEIHNDSEILNTTFNIKDCDGYTYLGWNVQLPDGTVQYTGNERNVNIEFSGWYYEKNLNIEYKAVNDKKLTVNYIDTKTKKVIKTNAVKAKPEDKNTVKITFDNIKGYVIDDWTLKLPDGLVETEGRNEPVIVVLSDNALHKILDINCVPTDDGNVGDSPGEDEEKEIVIVPSGICDGVIEWTETDSHNVLVGYSKSGKRLYERCRHTFTYKTVLSAEAEITPDILKSGYGFEVEVDCDIETEMIENDGCRNWGKNRKPSLEIKNPTNATVFIPWNMTNRLGSQGKSISMVPDGALKFTLPESLISEIGAKKIYTPVELAGTMENPESHSFEIYIGGGGVGEIEFCQKIDCTITINGDMYEDDFSGAN